MQKVIFLTIDVRELAAKSHETNSLSTCNELNELLEAGWYLEEWSFLLDDPIDDKVPIMAVLNDDTAIDLEEEWEAWQDEAEMEPLEEPEEPAVE